MPAVVVEQLRKSYGGRPVVDGVTFDVEEGEVFALLGPNGAGKTTTVEILEGHRRADAGSVTVLGFDPRSSPGRACASASASCCRRRASTRTSPSPSC